MTGGTRGAGPGGTTPGPAPGGIAFGRALGIQSPRGLRVLRAIFCGIWLVYLGQPIGSLMSHRYGVLYISGAIAIVLAFCALYVWVVGTRDPRRKLPVTRLLPLFALAALACVAYDGAKWNALWIYVSAACGLVLAGRAVAIRAVLVTTACYALFSWLGHDKASDFLLTLIPVAFVGLAMIGFRIQIDMTRELTAARETVARLAASEERLRLARDMHDLTGQSLSMITLKSELAARLLRQLPRSQERDRVSEEIEQVAAVSRQTLHDIREALSGYRRPTLAVEIITARTALEAAGITPHEDAALTLLSGTFDPDAEAALAWCLREAATNVVRHSGARNCHIGLTRTTANVVLQVADDGRGPTAAGTPPTPDECPIQLAIGSSMSHSSPSTCTGTGLHGMSERLSAVGGHLELRPGTPAGFRLIATAPAGTTSPAGTTAPAGTAPAATTAPAEIPAPRARTATKTS